MEVVAASSQRERPLSKISINPTYSRRVAEMDEPARSFAACVVEYVRGHVQKLLPAASPPPLLMDAERLSGVRDWKKHIGEMLSTAYGDVLPPDQLVSLKITMPILEKTYFVHTAKPAVRQSFQSTYIDTTIVDALYRHVIACWEAYSADPVANQSPLISLMQSTRFGKSRLLYELAKRVNEGNDSNSMRLLYVCPDKDVHVTANLPVHLCLRDYLFPTIKDPVDRGFSGWVDQRFVDELASRLVTIFMLANASDTTWASIGEQWLRLFTSEGSDVKLVERLKEASEVDTEDATKSDTPAITNRVLILAIDQAEWLRPCRAGGYVDWHWTLSRALVTANQRLRQRLGSASCGIFTVLVTVYSLPVKCLTAEAIEREDEVASGSTGIETQKRPLCVRRATPFEPFILTHTMDVFHKKAFYDWQSNHKKLSSSESWCRFHEELVLRQDSDAAFSIESLVSMGRPLWKACTLSHLMVKRDHVFDEFYRVVTLATHMLLASDWMPTKLVVKDKHMGGIASVLCRTSVQINSATTMASQLIARHMAVLTTGGNNQKRYQNGLSHCSYPSDPMLAFGATEVWYEGTKHSPNWLTSSILPSLYKMVSSRTLLVENMGILVAELVLLVVMDQCVASSVKFHHQFMDMTKFMSYLPPAVGSSGDEAMEKWRGWKLGFNHFMQLERMPTEGCLWAMVSRRAAGAFPRTQRGMDLFIPMFIGGPSPRVSIIIIQVHSGGSDDVTYASRKSFPEMRPYELFEPAPYVESLGPSEILRFVMRLDSRDEETNRRFYKSGDTGYWQMNCAGPWKRDAEEVVPQVLADEFIDLLRMDWAPSSATAALEAYKDSELGAARARSSSKISFSSLHFGEADDTSESAVDTSIKTKIPRGRPAKRAEGARRKSPRLS